MTKVLTCTCVHKFQDERYGTGRRVHNPVEKSSTDMWRCTVCSKERTV